MPRIVKRRLAPQTLFFGLLLLGVAALSFELPPPVAPRSGSSLPTTVSDSVVVLFTGDLMFDRTIRLALEKAGGREKLFEGVSPLLSGADAVVGNLEGPVTHFESVSEKSAVGDPANTRFTFPSFVPAFLHEKGFRVVSIGNNHVMDFGTEGLEETKERLTRSTILFVGDPSRESGEPVTLRLKGITIAFAGYNDFLASDPERTRAALRAGRDVGADFVVVLAHWGEEYDPLPSTRIRTLARSFVSAGADLIVGTHSHVVGEREDLGFARVYYSLGNFVFDQYFSDDVRCGMAVKLTLTKERTRTVPQYEDVAIGLMPGARTVLGCTN